MNFKLKSIPTSKMQLSVLADANIKPFFLPTMSF